jgi:hypothetical protein
MLVAATTTASKPFCYELGGGDRVGVGQVVLEGRAVDGDHVDAVLGELVGERVDALAEDGRGALAAALGRQVLARRDCDERRLGELAVEMLCDDENVAHDR